MNASPLKTLQTKKGFLARLMTLFIPSVLLISVISFFIYRAELDRDRNRIKISEIFGVNTVSELIYHKLDKLSASLDYLVSHDAFKKVIERTNQENLKHLTVDFSHFVKSMKMFYKVRWIDQTGRERFRVDYAAGKSTIAKPDTLQNKANRYYVKEILQLNPGEIYLSPFDLNVEHDQIEVPYKPVIRIAKPVVDQSGKKRGMLVLTYLGEDLLADFVKAASASGSQVMLLNQDSYWLYSPVPEEAWGFMFNKTENFSTRFPLVWKNIEGRQRGQFLSDEGLWTFETIHPLKAISASKEQIISKENENFWKVVSCVRSDALKKIGSEHIPVILGYSLPLLLIAFIGSWRVASTWTERLEAQAEARQAAKRMSMLLENLGEGVFGVDKDGICIFINPAALAMVGYEHDEVVGKSPHQLFRDTAGLLISSGDRDLTTHEEQRRSGEDWFIKKDGTKFPVQLSESPIMQDDAVVGAVIAFQDISERKWAEDAIQKQIEFTEKLISNASTAIFVLTEGHKVLYWNRACEVLTGVPASNIIGTNQHWKPFYAEERPCLADLVLDEKPGDSFLYAVIGPSPLLQGGLHAERWYRKLGGKDRYLTIDSAPIRNPQGTVFAAIETIQDITEHKKAEEARRESESRYRMLVENSPETVFLQSEGRFIYLNPAGVKLFGASSQEELLGTPVLERIHPDFRPMVRERMRILMEENKPVEVAQQTYLRLDGSHVSVEVLATPFSYYERPAAQVIVRDLTERKQMVSELQNVKQRLEMAIDSGQLGIWDWDIEHDAMVWNDRMLQLYGIKRDELTGGSRDWQKNIHPEDIQRVTSVMETAIEQGQHYAVEFRTVHRDGGIVEKDMDGVVIRNSDGKAIRVIAMSRDISERKQLEAQLRQAQKMEAIGTLAGGIAHDFNNILTAIVGYAHLLQIQLRADDPMASDVLEILRSADHAAQLTKGLLAFSRKQSMKVQLTDLGEIVQSFEQLIARMIGEDIELLIQTEDSLSVLADQSQLEQVLMNLATNARDAMPQGGVLTIQATKEELGESFIRTRGFGKVGVYARLTVMDNGTGMEEEVRRRVFDPFFTTKEMGKGTGLGLAIVYGIVKQHQGYIDVSSVPGTGTTIHIYLPIVLEKEHRPQLATDAETGLPRGDETILLVEDSEEVRNIIQHILESVGYSVIIANNGEEAIQTYQANCSKIDLVITDVIMPKKNGLQVYEELRTKHPTIKVLFMSGYTADIITLKELTHAGLPFIAKPIDPRTLLVKLRDILAH